MTHETKNTWEHKKTKGQQCCCCGLTRVRFWGGGSHLELDEDIGQGADLSKDLAHQPVSPGQRGVHGGAHPDETSWHGKLELVLLGIQRNYSGIYRGALDVAALILDHDPGADLDELVDFQNTLSKKKR